MADTSPCGWNTVKNYVSNPLADDSDDEIRINKAENKALKEEKERQKGKNSKNSFSNDVRGFAPFSFPRQPFCGPMSFQFGFPGMPGPRFPIGCFHCWKPDHKRKECAELKLGRNKMEKESNLVKDEYFAENISFDIAQFGECYEYTENDKVCVRGRLKAIIQFWKNIDACKFIIDTIDYGYKIPFYYLPQSKFSCNNRSAIRY
jgi:hypothetical protein